MTAPRGKRPNILFVMFDQLSPQSLPCYGHPLVQAPHLQALAERGVVFDSAYCNSPLCAPARFSLMAGQLPSRIGAWDNAAEFPSSVPTYAHYLRRLGYRTCLAGKMHFVGPDQLHGYEDRVTTDIYPGDFGWTPTWDEPDKIHWWFHNMLSVVEAGPYDRSLEWDYDEEVGHQAVRWLYDHARGGDERPFMLTVSYIQPHDPYLAPRADWARYDHAAIDMPAVPYIPPAERDPLSRRMYELYDRDEYRVTDEQVRNARHGYYAMISYVDRKFGELLAALAATGLADDTIVDRHRRPRRHAGRAGPVVQDELLRALDARAAHPARAAPVRRPPRRRERVAGGPAADLRRPGRRGRAVRAGERHRRPQSPRPRRRQGRRLAGQRLRRVHGRGHLPAGLHDPPRPLQVHRLRRRSAAALRPRRAIRTN